MFKFLPLIALLAAPGAARAAGPGAYYFIAVQNGSYNFGGGAQPMAESYDVLRSMVKLADERSVKLTLLFSAQYADFISSDTARLAELQAWKKAGHEAGAYHQGPETSAWDGYTDLRGGELARVRRSSAPPEARGHEAFFASLARLEPGLKTGCMVGGADAGFLAAAPPYEVCRVAAGSGGGAARGAAGVNEAIFTPAAGGKRRNLSAFHPADRAGIEAAQQAFGGMELGVYGAAFRSTPAEFGAFYAWLNFLGKRDPQGLRSRTVAAVAESGLLTEKKRAAPKPGAAQAEKRRTPREKAPAKQAAAPQQEAEPEIPRLRPVPSLFGGVGRRVPGLRGPRRDLSKPGVCGDGICDVFERATRGLCSRDCGN